MGGYPLSFIIGIAERKFGKGDRRAIDRYIAEFDPDKPEFAEDIVNYNLTVGAENAKAEENSTRYRILQDMRYLKMVYRRGLTDRDAKPEGKASGEAAKNDVYRIRTSFVSSPVEYRGQGEKKYLLYSAELQKKYGFHHKVENVVGVLRDLCGRENADDCYRSYFKTLFAATVCVAGDRADDMMELFTDFDNFMTEVLKSEIAPQKENAIDVERAKHGGMEGKELVGFLGGYAGSISPDPIPERVSGNEKTAPEPDLALHRK